MTLTFLVGFSLIIIILIIIVYKYVNTAKDVLIFLGCLSVVLIAITLPFHYIPSRGMIFPKQSLTFSYTFITEGDISRIINRYNTANFLEQAAINNEPLMRKLRDQEIIVTTNPNDN
jgi:hypothetical protein